MQKGELMRLIDTDSLIKDIKEQTALLRALDKDNEEITMIADIIEKCFLEEIDKQPTIEERKWIPCKERLPKIGQYVLRTVKGFSWNCEECWTVDIGLYDTNDGSIVAWMPLPEPYRKEGEQE